MNTDVLHVVSLSGGKDSTAMLLLMIERGWPIDAVLNAEHLFRERGLHITTLKSSRSFGYLMFDEPKQRPSCIANRQRRGWFPWDKQHTCS